MPYEFSVIRSFRSKALKRLWTQDDDTKLPVPNKGRVRRILDLLNAATSPEDLNLPGSRFHGLQGKPKRYSVDASANYRVTYDWDKPDAIDVDLEDYH